MEDDGSMMAFLGTFSDEDVTNPAPLPVQPLAQVFPAEDLGKTVREEEGVVASSVLEGVSTVPEALPLVQTSEAGAVKRKRGEESVVLVPPKPKKAPRGGASARAPVPKQLGSGTSQAAPLLTSSSPGSSSAAVGSGSGAEELRSFADFWGDSNATVPYESLCALPEEREFLSAGRLVERRLKNAAARALAATDYIHQLRIELRASKEDLRAAKSVSADTAKRLSQAELALKTESESLKKKTKEVEVLSLEKLKNEAALKEAKKGLTTEKERAEALSKELDALRVVAAEVEGLRQEKVKAEALAKEVDALKVKAAEVDALKAEMDKARNLGRQAAQHYYKSALQQVECLYPGLDPKLKPYMSMNHFVKEGKILKSVAKDKTVVVYERPEKS